MNKTVLTLALLSGVYSFNMNTIYAGDPAEEGSEGRVSTVVAGSRSSKVMPSIATVRAEVVVKGEVSKKATTKEEAIKTLTHYGSVALAGVASVAYMIAQPSHAVAVLVPWVAYSAPKMIIFAADMYNKAYNDLLESSRKPVVNAVVKAGVHSPYQEMIVQNLMGRSESYINKFVELFSSVKREALSNYQNFSMAYAISTLSEGKIGLVPEILKCFEDNGDVYSWYNIVEDAANSIRHGSLQGVCVGNEAVGALIKSFAARKTN